MRSAVPVLVVLLVAFILHGIWEHAHIGLYTGYGAMEGFLPVWALATLGDLAYTLVIVAVISLFYGGVQWMREASERSYIVAGALGFLVALMVEYKGLYLGRWAYTSAMPIVPLFQVGVSPLLQMTILTPLALFITKKITQHLS